MERSSHRATTATSAVAYVRMSTEHQQFSTANQMDVIKAYAEQKGFQIVSIFSDEGKSGLSIVGRNSLSALIREVQSGDCAFQHVLVFDVSRWGRFQDADESAYYEYICRRAGISVHYCAEQFENDGSPVATIIKSVKRAMAGEYSRELSSKVFQGACRLIQLGYKQGGMPGFGLRRMLINEHGERKQILEPGEQKSVQTDRVVLVPGPDEEVKWVRWMYDQFVEKTIGEREIAAKLNASGILNQLGRSWTRGTVHEVLTNEKYIGNNVYYRTSFKLKKKHVSNPPEMWIRGEGVFEAIVSADAFQRAQEIILARSKRMTDEEMLEFLRGLLGRHGKISGILIDEEDGPSSSAFRQRFGSLVTAYRLIGFHPAVDYRFIEQNRKLRERYPKLVAETCKRIESLGCVVEKDDSTGLLCINGEFTLSIVLCRHCETRAGSSRWVIRLDQGLRPDVTIAVRMSPSSESVHDYFVLPSLDMTWEKLRLAEQNGVYLDAYRFETLDFLFSIVARGKLENAA